MNVAQARVAMLSKRGHGRKCHSVANAAVHGGLDPVIDDKLLEQFVAVLKTLAGFLSEDST